MLGYVVFVHNPRRDYLFIVRFSFQNLLTVIFTILSHLKVDAVLVLPCMMERCL